MSGEARGSGQPGDGASLAALKALFERQRAASIEDPFPGYRERVALLRSLEEAVAANADTLADAIDADFGCRSKHETLLAEVFLTLEGIRNVRRNLKRWMRPEKRRVPLPFKAGKARILCQPLGVVGILSPWNYPFLLAVTPLAAALGAGNRVMLKPSETTPRTAELLERMVGDTFDPLRIAVVPGGPDVGEAFSRLPFDHLFFTGSTRVGMAIMRAASENLTPVTLELGGKSPAIVGEGYPLARAAERIVAGKFFNAGQTCMAPDYVLVPAGAIEPFVEATRVAVARRYPTIAGNPDYTAIVNDRHLERLKRYLSDAAEKGARIVAMGPANETLDPAGRKVAPTVIVAVRDDMELMREEVFGPLLPVVPYRSLGEAIDYVTARPRPLALYHFETDRRLIRQVLERTWSGGVCVNDTIFQASQEDLPFGGIGPSGMGAYHGREGFLTFSHRKAVFLRGSFSIAGLLRPPYRGWRARAIRYLAEGWRSRR